MSDIKFDTEHTTLHPVLRTLMRECIREGQRNFTRDQLFPQPFELVSFETGARNLVRYNGASITILSSDLEPCAPMNATRVAIMGGCTVWSIPAVPTLWEQFLA